MSRKRFATITVLLSTLGILTLNAQSHKFMHYGVENGMSSNTIFKLFQDRDGLMWFGTNDGLTRFDGFSLKTWRSNPSDSLSLGNNIVYALEEDSSGTLYVGTGNGLYAFDKNDESFREIFSSGSLPGDKDRFSSIFVKSMDIDRK